MVNWRGDEIKARMARACRAGVNQTMSLCVRDAKLGHPFTNRTVTAEHSIKIAATAKDMGGDVVVGIWGSVGVVYFKWLELGARLTKSRVSIKNRLRYGKKPPHLTQNSAALPWRGGSWSPTLRPAAVRHYPILGKLIKAAYQGGV